jgi:chromosome segregation ATPase
MVGSGSLTAAIDALLKAANAEEFKAVLAETRAELEKLDEEQIEKNIQANIEFNAGVAEKARAVQAAAKEIARRLETVNAELAELEAERAEVENSTVLDEAQKQKILAGLDMAEAALLAEKIEAALLLRDTSDALENAGVNAPPVNVFKAENQLTADNIYFPNNVAARVNNYIAG